MTGANIVSIAITLFAIAAGSLFNNVRISDLATSANKRFDDVHKRFDDMRDLIRSENARLDQKLDRISETLTAIAGDHEQCIRSIERRRR